MNENTSDENKKIRIVLNSKNSEPIKQLIKTVSDELMEKNKELYRRLGNK